MFPFYLDHSSSVNLVANYLNSTAYAQSKGKELIMFETNTASCGGFAGISDSFGAALWGLDYALQLAYANFSGVLMHTGGQTVYYNVRPHSLCSTIISQLLVIAIYRYAAADDFCHRCRLTVIHVSSANK